MGRSEVRLKPEGNSVFEEPQKTHVYTRIDIDYMALLGELLRRCELYPGQGSKAFSTFKSDYSDKSAYQKCIPAFVTEYKYLVLAMNNLR